jgi:hypothetical protein
MTESHQNANGPLIVGRGDIGMGTPIGTALAATFGDDA